MADEREVTIVIRGKNLTGDEFAKARKEVAGLTDEVGKQSKQTQSHTGTMKSFVTDALGPVPGAAKLATAAVGALGGIFTARSILNWAQDTIAFAGNLIDVAQGAQLTTDELQELAYAGRQVGLDMTTTAGMVSQLAKRVASGDDSARSAIAGLGLDFEHLRTLSPADLFEVVIDALGRVSDPLDKTSDAVALFKGQFDEAIRLADEGLGQLRQAAHDTGQVADQQLLASLERSGQAVEDLGAKLKVLSVMTLGPVAQALLNSSDAIGHYFTAFSRTGTLWGALATANGTLSAELQAQADATEAAAIGAAGANDEQGEAIDSARRWANELTYLRQEAMVPLSEETRRQIEERKALGQSEQLIAEKMHLSTAAVKRHLDAQRDAQKVAEELQRTREKAAEEYAKLLEKEAAAARAFYNFVGQREIEEYGRRETLRVEEAAAMRQYWNWRGEQEIEEYGRRADLLAEEEAALRAYWNWVGEQRMLQDRLAIESTNAWQVSVHGLVDSFVDLAEIGGESFRGLARDIGNVMAAIELGQESMATFNEGGAQNQIAGIAGGVSSIAQATSSDNAAISISGGALTGMQTGAMVGSMIPVLGTAVGAAIGAAAGAIVGVVRTINENLMRSGIIRDFGVDVGDEAADTIQDTADDRFGGSRQAATIFHLRDIVEEGGLGVGNLTQMTARLHDVFSLIQTDQMTLAEGTHVLDQNWQAFVAAGTNGFGLLSRELREIIQLNRDAGTQSTEIGAYVVEQAGRAVGGLTTFLRTGVESYDALTVAESEFFRAQESHTAAVLSGDAERIRATEREVARLEDIMETHRALADTVRVTSQASATAMSATLLATYGELIDNGVPVTDAVASISEGFTALEEQMARSGLSGSVAFDDLRRVISLANDEIAGPAIDAVQGLGQSLIGVSNSGLLTEEIFVGLSSQVQQTFDALIAQGHDGDAAMQLMQPTLQAMWELWQENGYAVDAHTEALLRDAEVAGVVGEQHVSAQDKMLAATERMADSMDRLVELAGGTLPTAFKGAVDEMVGDADRLQGGIKSAIDNIPKEIPITIRGKVEIEGMDSSTDIPGHARGGVFAREHLARIAEGGRPEIVGDVDFMTRALAGALERTGQRGQGRAPAGEFVIHQTIVLDGQVIDRRIVRTGQDALNGGHWSVPVGSLTGRPL